MDAPRPARPDEFSEVMNFVDRVFRPGQRGRFILQSQYPHAYQPQYARRLILIRDQGQLVGNLAIHPLVLRLEEARLRAGGIGVVGAHPERRGQGIMTALLEDAIRRMQQARYPLSVLGGDRQRYGWFGWENGGVQNVFTLTSRCLGDPPPAERRLRLERFAPDPQLGRQLQRLGTAHPCWVERPLRDIPLLFDRVGRQTWIGREGDRFAYVVLQRAGRRRQGPYEALHEAGGDLELARSMIRVLMARHKIERLSAIAGPNSQEVELYLPGSAHWRRECALMVKIVDLPLLLQALGPLLRRRAREAGVRGHFHLVMRDQSALLDLGPGRAHRVALDARDMVGLFFGIQPLAERFARQPAFEKLGRLLPLPLYLPPINHI